MKGATLDSDQAIIFVTTGTKMVVMFCGRIMRERDRIFQKGIKNDFSIITGDSQQTHHVGQDSDFVIRAGIGQDEPVRLWD